MRTLIINIVSAGAEFEQTENMQIVLKCECYKGYIVFFFHLNKYGKQIELFRSTLSAIQV